MERKKAKRKKRNRPVASVAEFVAPQIAPREVEFELEMEDEDMEMQVEYAIPRVQRRAARASDAMYIDEAVKDLEDTSSPTLLPIGLATWCLYIDGRHHKCEIVDENEGLYTVDWADNDGKDRCGHPLSHFQGHEEAIYEFIGPAVNSGGSASEWAGESASEWADESETSDYD